MALTNKQVDGVCSMFARAFVYAKGEAERKKILIDFEDTFSKGIGDWKKMCSEKIRRIATYVTIL